MRREVERLTLTCLLADYAQQIADLRADALRATQRAERAEALADERLEEIRTRPHVDLEDVATDTLALFAECDAEVRRNVREAVQYFVQEFKRREKSK